MALPLELQGDAVQYYKDNKAKVISKSAAKASASSDSNSDSSGKSKEEKTVERKGSVKALRRNSSLSVITENSKSNVTANDCENSKTDHAVLDLQTNGDQPHSDKECLGEEPHSETQCQYDQPHLVTECQGNKPNSDLNFLDDTVKISQNDDNNVMESDDSTAVKSEAEIVRGIEDSENVHLCADSYGTDVKVRETYESINEAFDNDSDSENVIEPNNNNKTITGISSNYTDQDFVQVSKNDCDKLSSQVSITVTDATCRNEEAEVIDSELITEVVTNSEDQNGALQKDNSCNISTVLSEKNS